MAGIPRGYAGDIVGNETTLPPKGKVVGGRSDTVGKTIWGGGVVEGVPPDMQKIVEKMVEKELKKKDEGGGERLTDKEKQNLKDFEKMEKEKIELKNKVEKELVPKIAELTAENEALETRIKELEDENETIVKDVKSQLDALNNELQAAEESNKELKAKNDEIVEKSTNLLERNVKTINKKIEEIEVRIRSCTDENQKELSKQIKEVEELTDQLRGSEVGGSVVGSSVENVNTARSSLPESEQSFDQSNKRIDQELSKVSTLVSELNKLELRSNKPDTALTFSEDDQAMKNLDDAYINGRAPLPQKLKNLIGYSDSNVTDIEMDKFTNSLELFYLLDIDPKDGEIKTGDIEKYYKNNGKPETLGSTLYNKLAKKKGSISIVEWISKEPTSTKDFPVPDHWKQTSGNAGAILNDFVNWL